ARLRGRRARRARRATPEPVPPLHAARLERWSAAGCLYRPVDRARRAGRAQRPPLGRGLHAPARAPWHARRPVHRLDPHQGRRAGIKGAKRTVKFASNSRMAAEVSKKDWSETPIGPQASWCRSLQTVLRIMLTSRYAMWMGWGKELRFFYNDAYAPTLGV